MSIFLHENHTVVVKAFFGENSERITNDFLTNQLVTSKTMHLARFPRRFTKIKTGFARQSTQPAVLDHDEYTDTPEYPPILDMSLEARKKRDREALYERIKNINTVEEKQIALNMPKYYGFRSIVLREDKVPYNAIGLVQHYTRTHFIPIEKLPEIYGQSDQLADQVVKEIKSQIEDAIAIESSGVERNIPIKIQFEVNKLKSEAAQREDAQTSFIIKQINRIITNNLTDKLPHILSAQVDYDPRHEAFWFVGGIDVPWGVINWRKKQVWFKDRLYEPVDRVVQYFGTPLLTLRSRLPLKPLLPYSEAENPEFKVPKFTTDPKAIGYFDEMKHGTNIPGYWPGDFDEYSLLSIHGRGHMLDRKESYGEDDNLEALHCQAMKASFGWLNAQANYQGFTTYNDITYPLVTQTAITNGQLWSLYAYQMNTIEIHNEKVDENPKHNICYGTKPLKLYDTLEDGKVKGLNEDVLKMIVQFYANVPEERDHEMKPYLGKDEKYVADIEDDKRRCWLESRYKLLMSNRPRHKLLPETYMWEKIYKIIHNTRAYEPKRRPFELGINPYQRRLDEHLPPYIPKILRPYPKARKRFETMYYPKV